MSRGVLSENEEIARKRKKYNFILREHHHRSSSSLPTFTSNARNSQIFDWSNSINFFFGFFFIDSLILLRSTTAGWTQHLVFFAVLSLTSSTNYWNFNLIGEREKEKKSLLSTPMIFNLFHWILQFYAVLASALRSNFKMIFTSLCSVRWWLRLLRFRPSDK